MARSAASTGQRRAALPGGIVLTAIALVAVVGVAAWRASADDAAAVGAQRVQSRHDPGAEAPATPAAPVRSVKPVKVRIPAIGVDAPVVTLGINDDGTLEVPDDFDNAGWWTGGAKPGEPGPAVVVGHVDSQTGPAVFYRLRELRRGDRIALHGRSGRVVRFAVDRLEQHPKDDFPTAAVYGDTPEPTLRLITCGGAFDRSARSYVDNVIVHASLVG